MRSLRKKQELLAGSLFNPLVRDVLALFVSWARRQAAVGSIAARFSQYVEFFERSDAADPNKLDESFIKLHFTPDQLRRMGYIEKFLTEAGYLTSTNQERETWSDQRRVDAALGESIKRPWGSDIVRYGDWLRADIHNPLAVRTIRLYLRAATSLMTNAVVNTVDDLTSKHIQDYLKKIPGQRASLHSFVAFINIGGKKKVEIPPKKRKRPAKLLGQEIAALRHACESADSESLKRASLAKLLSLVYGIPLPIILRMRGRDTKFSDNNDQLCLNGVWVEIDHRLSDICRELLHEHLGHGDRRLFPGRGKNDFLSTMGVAYHTSKVLQKSNLKFCGRTE